MPDRRVAQEWNVWRDFDNDVIVIDVYEPGGPSLLRDDAVAGVVLSMRDAELIGKALICQSDAPIPASW